MKWYFTFMQRQTKLKNKFVVFEGTFAEARQQMNENFGTLWAFQYDEKEWKKDNQVELYGLEEIK